MKNEIGRWDYEAHCYNPVIFPDNWVCTIHADDMDMNINCANCGVETKVGKCYTSMEIHEQLCGFGFYVCENCHHAEWDRRVRYGKDE